MQQSHEYVQEDTEISSLSVHDAHNIYTEGWIDISLQIISCSTMTAIVDTT